jgi:hypothetical protein
VQNGLAVLRSPDELHVYRLQRTVPELALVDDSFHTKPLLRIQQSADRFQVLALRADAVELYEGNRDALYKVDLAPEVPATAADMPGMEGADAERENRIYGAPSRDGITRHGTHMADEVRSKDTERYFRAVDRAIEKCYSRPMRLPLLLAALPEHQPVFRRVTANPFLRAAAIDVHPADLALDELRQRAWQAILPEYRARLGALISAFRAAEAKGNGSANLVDAAHAAFEGRVATLLIDADRTILGRIEAATGAIETADAGTPGVGDLLDDVGEKVLRTGGEVVVVPSEDMPAESGIAAIYRY